MVIDKAVRVLGPRNGNPALIDGQCGASAALTIAADKVTLRDVHVLRGTFATIDVQNRDRVMLRDVFVSNQPGPGRACPGVEYGVNVFASTRVKLSTVTIDDVGDNVANLPQDPPADRQYEDAAIYVGGIAAGAGVIVQRGFFQNSVRGLIVEDSSAGGVRVKNNLLRHNDTGILLHNSDGVLVQDNTVTHNGDSARLVGIDVDATSDDNRLLHDDVSGYPTDVSDAGTSNCWAGTTFTTGSVPPGGCP